MGGAVPLASKGPLSAAMALQPEAAPRAEPSQPAAAPTVLESQSRQRRPVKLSQLQMPWWAVEPSRRPSAVRDLLSACI